MLHHRTLWVVAIRNGLRLWRLSRNLSPEIHDLSFLPFVLHVYIPYCSRHTQDNCSRSNHSCSLQNSPHLHCSDLNSKIQSHNMSYCICKLCPMNDGVGGITVHYATRLQGRVLASGAFTLIMGPECNHWNAFLFRFPETHFLKVVRIATKLYH